MGTIEIRKADITGLDTDAIVNAANEGLQAGGGVCGAIFAAAGRRELQQACDRIGHCDTGSAEITWGFRLRARYIIHAVGPIWRGGDRGEPQLLYRAYQKSLELAEESGCRSIGFPLISAGIYGYPVPKAWRQAVAACREYLKRRPESGMRIVFAVIDDEILRIGRRVLREAEEAEDAFASAKRTLPKLRIAGEERTAIFFHRPEEPYGFLSNWYPAEFTLGGIRYTSSEQYLMREKCRLLGDTASADAVLKTDDPEKQQEIGRNASPYLDQLWAGARQLILLRAIAAKFSQNAQLKRQLLATGDAILAECAVSDRVWACGLSLTDEDRLDAAKWRGTNLLGFALMEVRETLRSQESADAQR